MKRLLTLMLTAALSLPVWALDEAGQARLHAVQTRWAEIQYQLPEAQREANGFHARTSCPSQRRSAQLPLASAEQRSPGGGRRLAWSEPQAS